MLNYMRAECYKAARRKSLLVILILLLAGVTTIVLLLRSFSRTASFDDALLSILQASFLIGFYITIVTGEAVFADQY
ncbi:MAG: hypothetical protein LUG13_05370 [Oscillospiraceae bacterium]|nr:hypothetical protein [Oscillospiraceae bacterium]